MIEWERRAADALLALAILVSLTTWVGTASAAPDAAAIAAAVQDLEADHDRAIASGLRSSGGRRTGRQAHSRCVATLSPLGQHRALGALSRLAKDHDAAVEALVEAARSEDEELQNRALDALQRATPRGRDGLVMLLSDPGLGDRSASLLARTEPGFAIGPLLEAMTGDGGADRPALRNALGTAVPTLRRELGQTASCVARRRARRSRSRKRRDGACLARWARRRHRFVHRVRSAKVSRLSREVATTSKLRSSKL